MLKRFGEHKEKMILSCVILPLRGCFDIRFFSRWNASSAQYVSTVKHTRTQALTISHYRFIKYLKVCFCFTPKMNKISFGQRFQVNPELCKVIILLLFLFFLFRLMKNRNNNQIMATSQTKCVDEMNDNVEMRTRSVSKGYQYTCYDSLAASAFSYANALWNNNKKGKEYPQYTPD